MWATSGQTAVPVKIPITMMIMAIAGLLILPVSIWNAATDLAMGAFGAPSVLLVVHITAIGILLPAVIGVFYQLGPVAFVTTAKYPAWQFAQAICYDIAAISFLICWERLQAWGWPPLAITGTILVISILMFLWSAFDTTRRRTAGWPTTWFVYASIVHFLLLLTGGLTLVWGYSLNATIPAVEWLGVHALAGIFGIFIQLAMGFGYKLLPMFNLSHLELGKSPYWVWALLNGGLFIIDIGQFSGSTILNTLGILLVALAIVTFLYEVRRIIRARIRRKIEWPMISVILSWLWLAVGAFGLFSWQCGWIGGSKTPETLFVLVMLSGIVQMVAGFFYKMIPFLIWTDRYGSKGAGANTPLLQEAVRTMRVKLYVWLWNISTCLLLVGIWFSQVILVLGAAGLLLSSIINTIEWARIISPQGVFPVAPE